MRQHVLAFTFKRIKWRASLRSFFSSERILVQSCNKVQNSVLHWNINIIEFVFCLRCFGFSPILPPHRVFLLAGVSFNDVNLVKEGMILLSACDLNSRINMMTINEVSLNGPKVFPSFCVISWLLRSTLFPVAVRFSSPYGGFPSQSGFLEFVVSSW